MKIFKSTLIVCGVLCAFNGYAQKSAKKSKTGSESRFSLSLGAGIANYNGDLIKNTGFLTQSHAAFSLGTSYAFTSRIAARFDIGLQKIGGSDSKTGGAYADRNLSFKSKVFDFALSAEYTILNLDKFPLSPYVSAGVGVVTFDPYAINEAGQKQFLAELGTEGQLLSGNSGKYNTSAIEFPLGVGVKYPVNDKFTVALDFNYRITKTDYLDDVSSNSYPSKAALDAINPGTSKYTFRGTGAYPTGRPRGNPENDDAFFTTQLKVIFKL